MSAVPPSNAPSLRPLASPSAGLIATSEELAAAKAQFNRDPATPPLSVQIDIFDPKALPAEQAKIRRAFRENKLETLLRSATWLSYFENSRESFLERSAAGGNLAAAERNYWQRLAKVNSEYWASADKKKFLDAYTKAPRLKFLLEAWYRHYNPEKSPEEIREIYEPYEGRETVLFNRLYKKYVDPEWPMSRPLWRGFDLSERPTPKPKPVPPPFPDICQGLNYLPAAPKSKEGDKGRFGPQGWTGEEGALRRFAIECLKRAGAPPRHAERHVGVLLAADRSGVPSCGLGNLDRSICELPQAAKEPSVLHAGRGTVLIDGGRALGGYVAELGMGMAIHLARQNGIACVACLNSSHFGMAGYYSEMAAEAGFIGLAMSNAPPSTCPTGATRAALGANPLAFAAPAEDDALSVDMATSALSPGRVAEARRRGKILPSDTGADSRGVGISASLAAAKSLAPLGGINLGFGYKGYGLAMAVEVLCSVLAAGTLSPDMEDWHRPSVSGGGVSHCFIVVDPAAFAEGFASSLAELLADLRALPPLDAELPVVVPGDRRAGARQKEVVYDGDTVDRLAWLGKRLGVAPPKFEIWEAGER